MFHGKNVSRRDSKAGAIARECEVRRVSDAYPCSYTAPCKTFPHPLRQTDAFPSFNDLFDRRCVHRFPSKTS